MIRKSINYLFFALALIFTLLAVCYIYVSINACDKTYDKVLETPFNEYTLLPGTSKYMNNGKVNLFFTYRCNAATELWKNKKTNLFIISGDSTGADYDEPELMRKALIKNGVPDSVLMLDKKGYNTRASILFCKKMKIQNLTIVSQKFHNERAIVLANQLGIDANGYNAKPVYTTYGTRVWIREWFARVKLIIELLIK